MDEAARTGGEEEAVRDLPFRFGGYTLALDLANTEAVVRRRRRDFLCTAEDLRAWWEEARGRRPEERAVGDELVEGVRWNDELLGAAKRLRGALRSIFEARASGEPAGREDLAVLNEALRPGYHEVRATSEGGIAGGYAVGDAGRSGLLFPVALSALRVLTEGEPDRLRSCTNPNCVGLFYDTSKGGTRRWCGTSCMNRARSAERYAREKAGRRRP